MLEKPNAKKALLDIIKDTSAYKDIEKYLKYIKYLKDDKELLAKAFEQYIIDYKSSNKRHKKCDTDKKSKNFFASIGLTKIILRKYILVLMLY